MTLPTRDDGSLDPKRLVTYLEGLAFNAVDRDGELCDLEELHECARQLLEHEKNIRAHERERCAKWILEKESSLPKTDRDQFDKREAWIYIQAATAIRKMED